MRLGGDEAGRALPEGFGSEAAFNCRRIAIPNPGIKTKQRPRLGALPAAKSGQELKPDGDAKLRQIPANRYRQAPSWRVPGAGVGESLQRRQ